MIVDIPTFTDDDSSTLTCQRGECNHSCKLSKRHHKYKHCYKLDHKIYKYYAIYGHKIIHA